MTYCSRRSPGSRMPRIAAMHARSLRRSSSVSVPSMAPTSAADRASSVPYTVRPSSVSRAIWRRPSSADLSRVTSPSASRRARMRLR
jgi:hypothetical protein